MPGDDVTITIRADNGDVIRAFRDTEGRLRDMRGRFITEGNAMSGSMNRLSAAIGGVKGSIIPLATAAVPLGAALAPIALKAGAASVAVAAFGAAVAGQAGHLSEASKAQEKYSQAVAQHGRGSKQAADAQRALSDSLASMPAATARAAVAMGSLKSETKEWSDELASFTMVPVEKSFTLMGQMLPRLTPMVKGASQQLDRLVTVAGGAMETPGFDKAAEKFSTFANESLEDAVDGVIHFSRVLSEGDDDGPLKSFMEYAEQNGPALRETLGNMSDAVSTLLEASADAGPGMLTLVNAAAELVAALPPEVVTILMQTAVALKLVTLAGAGAAAVSTGIATLGARLTALRAASAGAGGGLTGVAAAFGTLGKAAKASIVVAGIAAAVAIFQKLSDMGKEAPPNVDRLTTSLAQLGRTGKVSGEAAAHFGKDFGKLHEQLDKVMNPSVAESINNWGADVTNGLLKSGDATEEFTKSMDTIDESLAGLVKGGNADLARAALASMLEGMSPEEVKKFKGELDGYDSALADLRLEQDLTADSAGVFGAAAQATSAKLEAQKASADGLRASILALNDVNRSAYDAQIGFEAALDGLSEAFKENGSTLDLNTEAGRANGQAMSAAAKSQDELIAAGLAAGESLGSMTKKSSELREQMMKLATDAFDGNKAKATEYVNTLLGAPSEIKTLVKLEREEAISGLQEVRAAVQATPDAHEVTVSTLNGAAIAALEAVGLKTEQLPDGQTRVYTANGSALGNIGAVSSALNRLNGKSATTYLYNKTINTIITNSKTYRSVHDITGKAAGGRVPRYAGGGDVQVAPTGLLSGPGTGTSDDILALFASGAMGMVSDTEFVVNAKQTKKHLPLLEAINDGRLPKFAGGGLTGGQLKGLSAPSDMASLKSTLSDVRSRIKDKTSGGTEARLLRTLDSVGARLITHGKSLASVNKALDGAKDKLNDLKSSASQLKSSISSNIVSGSDITRAATGEDSRVTINTLLSQARGDTAQAQEFASALATLKKRGLSGNLLEQVASAGVSGGGLETAQALLGASSGQLKELGSLNHNLRVAANAAGVTGADALYGASIKAQTAATAKLQKSQDKLEATMASLAKNLDKVIAKAPGKKAAGGIVGFAAAGGVRSNLTWVGEQGPELLDLPAGSRVWSNPDARRHADAPWASMLNAPRRPAAAAAGQMFTVQLHIGDKALGEVIIDPVRHAVHTRGGLRATFGER